jgi:purine-cytosine permease-like protein
MVIVRNGAESIRRLSNFAAPLLILTGFILLAWAWVKVGSFRRILEASYVLKDTTHVSIWKIFWPNLTGIVGFWSTLALNIPDFTRFARSQKDQAICQLVGMPTTMAFYSCIRKQFDALLKGEDVIQEIDENMVFGNLKTNSLAPWSSLLMAGYLKVVSFVLTDRGKKYVIAQFLIGKYKCCIVK